MNDKNDNEKKPQPDVHKLIEGIKALKPSAKQEKAELFAKLLPTIKEAIARNVSQKALLEFLKANGLKMSPNTFRAKLDAETGGGKSPAA